MIERVYSGALENMIMIPTLMCVLHVINDYPTLNCPVLDGNMGFKLF